jgi:hypothetical protein
MNTFNVKSRPKFNHILVGLIPGLILPLIVFYLIYLLKYGNRMPIRDYMLIMFSKGVLTQLLSLCVIPNLLLFFIFMWINYLYSARGVVFSVLIYAFSILIFKIL